MPVLVSWGRQNNVLQSRWLKKVRISSSMALEARHQKSRCGQGWLLLEALRGEAVHVSQPLVTPSSPWLVAASLQSLPRSAMASLCLCLCVLPLFLIGYQSYWTSGPP